IAPSLPSSHTCRTVSSVEKHLASRPAYSSALRAASEPFTGTSIRVNSDRNGAVLAIPPHVQDGEFGGEAPRQPACVFERAPGGLRAVHGDQYPRELRSEWRRPGHPPTRAGR